MKKLNLLALASASLLLFSSQSFGSPSAKGETDCSIQPTVYTMMTVATDEEIEATEDALLTFKRLCSKTGGMSSESHSSYYDSEYM